MIEIARDIFQMTMELADAATGAMEPLAGVRINVYQAGTTTPVDIYQRRTGAALGPAPETGGTNVGPGTFVTGPTGAVEFWCEGPSERDINMVDTIGPARIPARTMGWNFVPAASGSFPSAMIAGDGALTLAAMAPDVKRQMVQIGQVIEWFRPPGPPTIPVPSGFEICDGRQVLAGNHDFPGIGNFNVPDLRNMFILGADVTNKADGAAASGSAGTEDTVGYSPGIRGNGGSNVHALTAAQTPVKAHGHSASSGNSGNHQHRSESQWKFMLYRDGDVGLVYGGGQSQEFVSLIGAGCDPVYYTDVRGDHNHPITVNAVADGANGASHNNIPRYYGLLRLIKVRAS